MFGFNFFGNKAVTVTTEPTFELANVDGYFAIVKQGDSGTEVISSYTRKADAVRGAARKGITLANA